MIQSKKIAVQVSRHIIPAHDDLTSGNPCSGCSFGHQNYRAFSLPCKTPHMHGMCCVCCCNSIVHAHCPYAPADCRPYVSTAWFHESTHLSVRPPKQGPSVSKVPRLTARSLGSLAKVGPRNVKTPSAHRGSRDCPRHAPLRPKLPTRAPQSPRG